MRNNLMIFTATALMAGSLVAQENPESTSAIFKELSEYNSATQSAPAVAEEAVSAADVDLAPAMMDEPAPVIADAAVPAVMDEEPVAEAPKSSGWKFWKKNKQPEAPAEESVAVAEEEIPVMDAVVEEVVAAPVEAMLEAPAAGAEFIADQQGIADVSKVAPESLAARMYLRTLKERDFRRAEVKGMKDVKAAWSTALTLRSYPLAEEAFDKMGLTDSEKAVNVEYLFPQVDFPKGASAVYQPKMKTLFVRNKAENFAVLEAILDSMSVLKDAEATDQVSIEAKFVEVSEGTLEELGFEWRTTLGNPIDLGDNATIPAGQYLFDDALRGGPSGPAMPFSKNGGPYGSVGATGDWSSFRMTDTFSANPDSMTVKYTGSTPIDLLISALDQSSGADVLSAPRVVTKSGEEATIRVGEIHYYPEVYEGSTEQATMLAISYQDFNEKLLGVELVVTPEVDGSNIRLALNPRINELAGWQNYQMAPANSIYNHRQTSGGNVYESGAVIAKLPIFKKREIQTEVTISDGSTLGMGGLISEKVESFEDKVPVLGSLPLVGRLFRNEGERSVKRNLLMFVTANLVEPTGRMNTSRSFE